MAKARLKSIFQTVMNLIYSTRFNIGYTVLVGELLSFGLLIHLCYGFMKQLVDNVFTIAIGVIYSPAHMMDAMC